MVIVTRWRGKAVSSMEGTYGMYNCRLHTSDLCIHCYSCLCMHWTLPATLYAHVLFSQRVGGMGSSLRRSVWPQTGMQGLRNGAHVLHYLWTGCTLPWKSLSPACDVCVSVSCVWYVCLCLLRVMCVSLSPACDVCVSVSCVWCASSLWPGTLGAFRVMAAEFQQWQDHNSGVTRSWQQRNKVVTVVWWGHNSVTKS